MIQSEFWRDMESRFLSLHKEQFQPGNAGLHAMWKSDIAETGDAPWCVSGGPDHIRKNFIWCAERAALQLGHRGPGKVAFWLDRLKANSPWYVGGIRGEMILEGQRRTNENGWIELLCLASADYCVKCEMEEATKDGTATTETIPPRNKPPKAGPMGFDGLTQKESDLSGYYAMAGLTKRQRDCLSLRAEYGLSFPEIGRRLKINQKTVWDAFQAAMGKIDHNRDKWSKKLSPRKSDDQ